MKKVTLVFLVIMLVVLLDSCTEKKGDTIVNNNYYTADSLWVRTNGPYFTDFNNMQVTKSDEIILVSFNNVFISKDGGNSWQTNPVAPGNKYSLSKIMENGNIYLNMKDANNSKISNLYKSTDRGLNWNKINIITGLDSTSLEDISEDGSGNIYATLNKSSNQLCYFFKSSDNGNSWTQKFTQKAIIYNPHFYNGNIYFTISGGNNIVYAMVNRANENTCEILDSVETGNSAYFNHIYADKSGNLNFNYYRKSKDNGLTWNNYTNGIYYKNETFMGLGYNSSGIIFIYSNYNNLYKSSDYGESWKLVSELRVIPRGIFFDSKGYVYMNCYTQGYILKSKEPVK